MGLFSAFSASFAATKLANNTGHIWKDLVNFILFKGADLQMQESLFILEQAYALVVFTYFSHHPGTPDDKMDNIIYLLNENIETVLLEVWGRQMPHDDALALTSDFKENSDTKYSEWHEELLIRRELQGKIGLEFWTEAAIAKFMDEIVAMYDSEFSVYGDGLELSAKDKLDIHEVTMSHLVKVT